MKKYAICDDHKIKLVVGIPSDQEYYQVEGNLSPGDFAVEVSEEFVPSEHEVQGKKIVPLSDEKKSAARELEAGRFLVFSGLETDDEVDAYIRRCFGEQINVANFRLRHYKLLRKQFYPPLEEYLDATVKIANLSDPQARAQLQNYYDACTLVKKRFPKPSC